MLITKAVRQAYSSTIYSHCANKVMLLWIFEICSPGIYEIPPPSASVVHFEKINSSWLKLHDGTVKLCPCVIVVLAMSPRPPLGWHETVNVGNTCSCHCAYRVKLACTLAITVPGAYHASLPLAAKFQLTNVYPSR